MEQGVISVFHLPQENQVLHGHERRIIVEFVGQPHHFGCTNSYSFFIKYALVWGQVQLWVFHYSVCVAYKEVTPVGDKKKKK